ncbi:hypothetical protein [Runella sp.]|jgi:hypothetical protein|uniref:hypothetical protein n=1 Tax=Runella sp. TaxID=1960881 RepID=UPI00260E3569|nr:hypothetical protein [Runella sp.]
MFTQVLRVIGAGLLGGLFLFILPFLLLKAFLFFLFFGLVFRLFMGRRRRNWRRQYQAYYTPYEDVTGKFRKEGLKDDFQQPTIKI